MRNNERVASTITQVALRADVSKTTVSRYLNGRYEFMSAETRERIRKAIEEMEYRPNNLARGLKTEKSGTVGCVIADITNPISSILVKGINDVCVRNDLRVLFANTDNEAEKERMCIRSLLDNRVDGIVINTTGGNDDYLIEIARKGIPVVLADRWLIGRRHLLDSVATESYNAAYECFRFLRHQGYHRVAFFSYPLEGISSRHARYQAYIDAMREFFKIDGTLYAYNASKDRPEFLEKHLSTFFDDAPNGYSVAFASNGVVLLEILQAMKRLRYRFDGNPGVCGFDDWGWAPLIGDGITTITQNSYDVGVKAASLLCERIRGETGEAVFLEIPNRLIVRGSTDLKGRAGASERHPLL